MVVLHHTQWSPMACMRYILTSKYSYCHLLMKLSKDQNYPLCLTVSQILWLYKFYSWASRKLVTPKKWSSHCDSGCLQLLVRNQHFVLKQQTQLNLNWACAWGWHMIITNQPDKNKKWSGQSRGQASIFPSACMRTRLYPVHNGVGSWSLEIVVSGLHCTQANGWRKMS